MTRQRLTVQEAAEVLGTSVDAVRMRVRRGSLDSDREDEGRVYVWVNVDESETKPRLDGEDTTLMSEMRERIALLERELDEAHAANRENRRIIAALTQRIPELEAPASPDVPGSSETAAEEPERAEPRSGTGGPQEEGSEPLRDTAEVPIRGGSVTRPWWRRVFGR